MRWPVKTLSEVAEINPRRPEIQRSDDAPTSFVPMEGVDARTGTVSQFAERPYKSVRTGYTYFQNGDVIFAKITPCMQNGKHAIVANLIDGIGFGSTEFHVIRHTKAIIPEWIHLHLRRKEVLEAAMNTFTGAVGQQRVPQNFLETLEISVPEDVIEQKRLVIDVMGQLAEVERARIAAESQVHDAGLLRARILEGIFTQCRSVESKKLGDFATTTSGSTPSRATKQYWQSAEIPWVKTGEINFSTIRATEEAISKTALAECSLMLLPRRTVLIAMYGQGKTRGQSAILDIEATTNQACLAILPNDTWEPEFLYYWLRASYQELRNMSENRGGNQANLNGALLNDLQIPAPDQEAQLSIVRRIKAALSEVEALELAGKAMLTDFEQLPNHIVALAFES